MPARRILYVEDNEDLREAVALLLEDGERQITACGTSEEAMDAWQAATYDALVTDLTLPGQSGLDLAKALLALHPDLRVVICSGHGVGVDLQPLGPNVRWIAKPFEVERLEALLDERLPTEG
jgi:CheY-like chemotaxis protein